MSAHTFGLLSSAHSIAPYGFFGVSGTVISQTSAAMQPNLEQSSPLGGRDPRDPDGFRTMKLSEAVIRFAEFRRPYLRPRALYQMEYGLKQLCVMLGNLRVEEISIGHLRAYQEARQTNEGGEWFKASQVNGRKSPWVRRANASAINHEISHLQQIMKRAGEWDRLAAHYEPLPLPPPGKPKILSDREEAMVWDVAAQLSGCRLAYLVASITVNTGAGGTELRNLRFADIHLDDPVPFFYIKPDTAKNDFRGRPVVLNETARRNIEECMNRARELGASKPEHYVFPKRDRKLQRWDVTKPASPSWLQKQWKTLQDAVSMPWLTPDCFRHQHITLRAEAGESPELIAKDVGHASINMTRYYTHRRRETQSKAVAVIYSSRRLAARTGALK